MTMKNAFRMAAVAALLCQGAWAAKQARGYAHGFENGNLVPNWSFEAVGQNWDAAAKTAGFTVDPRFKPPANSRARTGSYVGQISGTATSVAAGGNFSFQTPYLPIKSGVYMYVLSMYVRGTPAGEVSPAIQFYGERNNPAASIQTVIGNPYPNSPNAWSLYTYYVYPDQKATHFRLALSHTNAVGQGGTLQFDDVVVEEQMFTSRNKIKEDVEFTDALGRPHQSQTLIAPAANNPYAGWLHSKRILVNTTATGANTRTPVTDFPLLVRLHSGNFTFSQARSNGEDIRFSDAEGNPIPYEIESWNSAGATAVVWVKVPRIEPNKSDNEILMYFGKSDANDAESGPAVFGSGLAYHLNTPPGGANSVPSSSGFMHSTPYNMETTDLVTGHIGNGMDLDKVDDRFITGCCTPEKQVTFSTWFKARSFGENNSGHFFYQMHQSPDPTTNCPASGDRVFYIDNGKLVYKERFETGTGQWEIPGAIAADPNKFVHIAVSYDNTSLSNHPSIYIDGQPRAATRTSVPSGAGLPVETDVAVFGNRCHADRTFDGVLDEVRMDWEVRSPDWVKLSYETQKATPTSVSIYAAVPGVPAKQVSGGVAYDAFGRPQRAYLPCRTGLGDLTDPVACASDPDMPNMGGVNYAEGTYANEPGDRVTGTGLPGANNSVASGRAVKGDYYFTNNLGIPVDVTVPPASAPTDTMYQFTWSKDPDGNFNLTWANRKGMMIQKARNLNRSGTHNNWIWSKTRYEYYQNGNLKRMFTPLDMSTTPNGNKYSKVSAYDTRGRLIASTSPDIGLERFWYNRKGDLRFSQDQGQRDASGTHTYFDYDALGRPLAKGTFAIASMTQAIADQDVSAGGTKNEKVGYLYDDLSSFLVRTGVSLDVVMPPAYAYRAEFLDRRHAEGRITCKYNLNSDSPAPGFSAANKLVAEFYSYTRDGKISRVFKYLGPVRFDDTRFQDASYWYDLRGRLESETIYENAISGTGWAGHAYEYDDRGRLKKITGTSDYFPIAEFTYASWGPLKSVLLGGDGSGTKGTRIAYAYHTLGGIREIKAIRVEDGKVLFQQNLGYDEKADPAMSPANPAPRYSGTITQQLYKLGTEANLSNPIRMANYGLDELGRLLSSDFQVGRSGTGLNPDGSINHGTLAWDPSDENDSYLSYDLNGRITSQRSGGVASAGNYAYKTDSYKLDYVTSKVSPTGRSMTAGNFEYNGRGAMTYDRSKDLSVEYGWDLLPVRFVKNARLSTSKTEQFQFYDAEGRRVSRVDAYLYNGSREWNQAKHFVTLNSRPYKEITSYLYSDGTGSSNIQTPNMLAGGVVGRLLNGKPEFYLMNHQGSLMMTVDANGFTPYEGDVIRDYLPMGQPRNLVTSAWTPPGPGFTGKEMEDLYSLIYFGSRFYDAELGVWISPDPARQYLSPYAYGPGNPTMGADPDGEWWGAVIGGAIGAVTATAKQINKNGMNMKKWDYGEIAKSTAVGAVTGLLTGGFGGLSSGLMGSMFYGAANSMATYAVTTGIGKAFGDENAEFTWKGFAGAAIGGAIGGVIPGFQGVQGGAFQNITSEMIHGTIKGAISGTITGGAQAWLNETSISNGLHQGFRRGAIQGFIGTGSKILMFGYAEQPSALTKAHVSNAENKLGVKLGDYGPTQRTGGVYGWIANGRGISLGTNAVNAGRKDEEGAEEQIHYIQQLKRGPFTFYAQAIGEQWSGGNRPNSYENNFVNGDGNHTIEYEANYLINFGTLPAN